MMAIRMLLLDARGFYCDGAHPAPAFAQATRRFPHRQRPRNAILGDLVYARGFKIQLIDGDFLSYSGVELSKKSFESEPMSCRILF